MKRLAATAVLCTVAALPALAAAQTSVTVLGLRAAAADQDVARRVTEALRQAAEAATTETGLQHTGRENDLSQLMIAFGCDDPTPSCLGQIGEGLSSDRIVYGRIQRRSGRGAASYTITLALYNVETGAIDRTLQEVIPGSMLESSAVMGPVSRFYAALTGSVVHGELAIRCAVEGATVRVGGEEVGTTGAEPIVLRDLSPGEVTVTVQHDEYAAFEESVRIEAGRLTELEVVLQPPGEVGEVGEVGEGGEGGDDVVAVPFGPGDEPPQSLAWLGWTLIGVGVASVAIGMWNSIHIWYVNHREGGILRRELDCWPGEGGMEYTAADREACPGPGTPEEGEFDNYEDDVFGTILDTDADDRRSSISEETIRQEYSLAQTYETLQFVMYGLAAVSVGVGLYLVIREHLAPPPSADGEPEGGYEDDDEGEGYALGLAPFMWDGGAALSAWLIF